VISAALLNSPPQEMRVTVFGASGLLGRALKHLWAEEPVVWLSSNDVDIRDSEKVSQMIANSRPDWIVLAAAYTDVDGCELNPSKAFAVNVDGAANVGRAAVVHNSRLLFLSSDYVFDGTKSTPYEIDDIPNPQSVYGQSKAEAEKRLLQLLPSCCIVRTSWLFGVGGKCFPDTILRLSATRPSIDVVDDQRGCPTYTIDLAAAVIALCRAGTEGIVHATNSGDCTWFEFAKAILQKSGSNTILQPTTSQKMARPAPRPSYSVLAPRSLHDLGLTMPTWQDALDRYLEERRSQA
jgi:dTDP-4-dehydrorhamnose reductase